jgi:thiol-disulfide isomerase/thioredoxin
MNMRQLAFGLLSLVFVLPAQADEIVPRYRFKVGQIVGMRSTAASRYNDRGFGDETEWTVWVVRANPDGGWRIIVRSSARATSLVDGKQKPDAAKPDVKFALFDLAPDGTITHDDSFNFQLALSTLFPKLPRDAAEIASGWRGKVPLQDGETLYRRSDKTTGNTFAFEGEARAPINRIYESTFKSRFVFDRDRGLIVRVQTKNIQEYGLHVEGAGSYELTSVESQGQGQAAAVADNAERYFAVLKRYETLEERAARSPRETDALLAKALAALTEARDTFLPIFRDQIDAKIKGHERLASRAGQRAKDCAELLAQPAASWKTVGLDGKQYALADYRGKVVVLDFWNRGCGWCVQAMPQVKQLADDFRDQPVAVLGMNLDKVESDAHLVIEAMSLNYPNLKAEPIAETYHVNAYPTLLILDQTGKIADVHIGYSPTLRNEVKARIQSLLDRP